MLVVDDDDEIREIVDLVLSDEGYVVLTARHGRAALDLLGRSGRPPRVILLDMRMPVMDGWEFARVYRQTPAPHAPIVAVTAAPDAAQRAAQIGAAAVLAKPFALDDLLHIVDHYAQPE